MAVYCRWVINQMRTTGGHCRLLVGVPQEGSCHGTEFLTLLSAGILSASAVV